MPVLHKMQMKKLEQFEASHRNEAAAFRMPMPLTLPAHLMAPVMAMAASVPSARGGVAGYGVVPPSVTSPVAVGSSAASVDSGNSFSDSDDDVLLTEQEQQQQQRQRSKCQPGQFLLFTLPFPSVAPFRNGCTTNPPPSNFILLPIAIYHISSKKKQHKK